MPIIWGPFATAQANNLPKVYAVGIIVSQSTVPIYWPKGALWDMY